jgi:hypothetical protein
VRPHHERVSRHWQPLAGLLRHGRGSRCSQIQLRRRTISHSRASCQWTGATAAERGVACRRLLSQVHMGLFWPFRISDAATRSRKTRGQPTSLRRSCGCASRPCLASGALDYSHGMERNGRHRCSGRRIAMRGSLVSLFFLLAPLGRAGDVCPSMGLVDISVRTRQLPMTIYARSTRGAGADVAAAQLDGPRPMPARGAPCD